MRRTGRCRCGAVTYELDGDLIATAVCHCEHCQRISGSAFSVNLIALPDQLRTEGPLTTYEERDDSGETVFVRRSFCPTCGSSILSEMVATGAIAVKAGTLDDRREITPTVEVWCEHRQPWAQLPGMAVSLDREA